MAQEYTIYDYWRILRRRRYTIISAAIIVLLATFYFTSRTKPIYRAHTTCEISTRMSSGTEQTGYYIWYPGKMMETEARIVTSRMVIEDTLRSLELVGKNINPQELDREVEKLRSMIRVSQEGDTNILRIEVIADTPEKAATVANTIAQVYIQTSAWRKGEASKSTRTFMANQLSYVSEKLRSSEEALMNYKKTGSLRGIKNDFSKQLSRFKLELKGAQAKYTNKHPAILDLKDKIAELERGLSSISKDNLVQTRLLREIKINEELYFMLNRRYKEMLVASAGDPPRVRVLNPAVIPRSALRSSTSVNMIMGLIVGLVFGIIMAFFREHLDTSIGTIEELEELLKLPVLGVIPFFSSVKSAGPAALQEFRESTRRVTVEDLRNRLVIFNNPQSSVSEAYRTLETNVEFNMPNKEENNTVLFTSTTTREGKSVTAANYALAAAQSNKKVLLVEADLRAPVLHDIFGVSRENGFSEILMGLKKMDEVVKTTSDFVMGYMGAEKIQKTTGIDDFNLITAGKLPLNPLKLFRTEAFTKFIEQAKSKYDLVIFDTAPILAVADSSVISAQVDSVVIVYKVGMVVRGALKRAINQINHAAPKVIGVVLNQIRTEEMRRKNSYYGYASKYYGSRRDQES